MNAPATAAAIAKPTDQVLPIADIVPSKTHIQELRRARFTKDALEDLANSIRRVGVLQPIVVRPAGLAGKYELVAGERRWQAAKLAGLTEIRSSVCVLSPEQVLEVQLIENLEREGLHELEEAEGYEELMKLKKISVDELVTMLKGKSRSYVYARIKLLALCPEARKAFYAGEIDSSKALLVARIGHHDTQRQALKDLADAPGHGPREPMSYRQAHRHVVERYMLALKSAPFDVKDATLVPKAGSCIPCPKRTGNQKDLFADVKNADVCTDPKCFDDKRQAVQSVERRRLEAAGRKVIYGDAAKKIFSDWDSPNGWARDRMSGGYELLTATTYTSGRSMKVADLLGSDFEPLLIQHPATGQIIKAATQQAIAAAAAKRQKSRPSRSSSPRPRAAPDNKPSIEDQADELARTRTMAAVHAKAPKTLGTADLKMLVLEMWNIVVAVCRQRAQADIAAAFGWKMKPTYHVDKPPKEVLALKPADFARFAFCCRAALEIDEEAPTVILKRLKIDPKAIEKAAIDELKKKATEAAAKKPKAKKKGGKK